LGYLQAPTYIVNPSKLVFSRNVLEQKSKDLNKEPNKNKYFDFNNVGTKIAPVNGTELDVFMTQTSPNPFRI